MSLGSSHPQPGALHLQPPQTHTNSLEGAQLGMRASTVAEIRASLETPPLLAAFSPVLFSPHTLPISSPFLWVRAWSNAPRGWRALRMCREGAGQCVGEFAAMGGPLGDPR